MNKKQKTEKEKENYDYRNYIKNTSNLKISRPDGDIYTREMSFREKKQLKLEEMLKK